VFPSSDKKVYTGKRLTYVLSMGTTAIEQAIETLRKRGGMLRTKEALAAGIHPRTLYQMREDGVVDQISRGVYRLASLADLTHPDLVTVALRVPRAIICLVSALEYHDATNEIPHEVQIALPRRTKSPRIVYPPLRVFWFSGPALSEGVVVEKIDGVDVHIYDLPKTVVDCFRFRNKLGLEVAVDALNQSVKRKGTRPADLLRYARMYRMENVILPYIEAIQ
jgi:predicted transcriptional regulator of viral defense system